MRHAKNMNEIGENERGERRERPRRDAISARRIGGYAKSLKYGY